MSEKKFVRQSPPKFAGEKEYGFPLPENSTPSEVDEVRPLFEEEDARRKEEERILNSEIKAVIGYCEKKYRFSIDETPRTVQEVGQLFKAKKRALEIAAREAVLRELEDELGFDAKALGIDHTWNAEEIRDALEWEKREANHKRIKAKEFEKELDKYAEECEQNSLEACKGYPWAEPDLKGVGTKPEDNEFSSERYRIAILTEAKKVEYGHGRAKKATEEARDELKRIIEDSSPLNQYFFF